MESLLHISPVIFLPRHHLTIRLRVRDFYEVVIIVVSNLIVLVESYIKH